MEWSLDEIGLKYCMYRSLFQIFLGNHAKHQSFWLAIYFEAHFESLWRHAGELLRGSATSLSDLVMQRMIYRL